MVGDCLRLGGSVLSSHPAMLGAQLTARLLPEMDNNDHIRLLISQVMTRTRTRTTMITIMIMSL